MRQLRSKQPPLIPYSLVDLIGNTPLLPLHRLAPSLPTTVKVYGKAEWTNPGGSVKDRAALWMIRDGEQHGFLRRGMRIIDASSGNTGIAYAKIGIALGYQTTIAMPNNTTPERKRILRSLGVELILTDEQYGMDLAIDTVKALVEEHPEQYFYPDQFNNPANAEAHYETTGPEMWIQTQGEITHFVAGLGTCGTFTGAGRKLRELNPAIQLIAMQPDTLGHGIEGVKHMATSKRIPELYAPELIDSVIEITTEQAFAMARELARVEGWMVGISAAANVAAALTVARHVQHGTIVTILCDDSSKYLSAPFWDAQVGSDGR